MANTYTQLYIQFVFAVQNRISLIRPEWEEELYKYVTGIIQNYKHKMIAINGMPDHLHVFVGLHPTQSISDLMRIAKGEASEWINSRRFVKGKFSWQEGYGAFSYGRSQVDQVYHYVMNQKKHHETRTFLEEYTELLKKFDVEYDERYIFHALEIIYIPSLQDGLGFCLSSTNISSLPGRILWQRKSKITTHKSQSGLVVTCRVMSLICDS